MNNWTWISKRVALRVCSILERKIFAVESNFYRYFPQWQVLIAPNWNFMFILWKECCVVIECRTGSEWWLTEKEAKWAWHSGRRAIHNVLITLSLWIKSFTFMVLWVGLNTFGYSIDDWSSKVELDLRLLRRSWFSHIGDLAPNQKCIASAPWSSGTSVNWQKTVLSPLLEVSRFYVVSKCPKI